MEQRSPCDFQPVPRDFPCCAGYLHTSEGACCETPRPISAGLRAGGWGWSFPRQRQASRGSCGLLLARMCFETPPGLRRMSLFYTLVAQKVLYVCAVLLLNPLQSSWDTSTWRSVRYPTCEKTNRTTWDVFHGEVCSWQPSKPLIKRNISSFVTNCIGNRVQLASRFLWGQADSYFSFYSIIYADENYSDSFYEALLEIFSCWIKLSFSPDIRVNSVSGLKINILYLNKVLHEEMKNQDPWRFFWLINRVAKDWLIKNFCNLNPSAHSKALSTEAVVRQMDG